MVIKTLSLQDAFVYQPDVFEDNRGWFMENYNKNKLPNPSVSYIQENHSFSRFKNTIRGLHIQMPPYTQNKLIRCINGAIIDVIIDIRRESISYLHSEKILLSAENKKVLFVPKGFLHGFITITDNVEVLYKVDNLYNKQSERSILFSDPLFSIDWGTDSPIMSEKDMIGILYEESDVKDAF